MSRNEIPKKIHYCWFGGNPLPKSAMKCIQSWKKYFPDYEIIQWNEDNYDVNKIKYIREAYQAKKYAFVSVENYQIVATGDSVAQAEQAYYALLEANGKKTDSSEYKTNELTGAITAINEAVVDGNSTYYFKLEGSDTIFIGDISLSNQFPLAKVGDVVTIEYVNSKDNSEVITSIKFG